MNDRLFNEPHEDMQSENRFIRPDTDEEAAQVVLADSGISDDERIDIVSRRVLERFKPAFIELAKR